MSLYIRKKLTAPGERKNIMNTLSENIVPLNPRFQNFIASSEHHRAPRLSQLREEDQRAPYQLDLNPLNYIDEPFRDVGEIVPFDCVESAWFWFIQAQAARNDGAQIVAGEGPFVRPCEPVDILRELERLHRNRRLLIDHLKVMRHYGVRLTPPDPNRAKEKYAATLWADAMRILGDALIAKKIVVPRGDWRCLSGL